MTKIILLITVVGLLTLYICDTKVLFKILDTFKKPNRKLYTKEDIRKNGYLAFSEAFYEIPTGVITLVIVIFITSLVILLNT